MSKPILQLAILVAICNNLGTVGYNEDVAVVIARSFFKTNKKIPAVS